MLGECLFQKRVCFGRLCNHARAAFGFVLRGLAVDALGSDLFCFRLAGARRRSGRCAACHSRGCAVASRLHDWALEASACPSARLAPRPPTPSPFPRLRMPCHGAPPLHLHPNKAFISPIAPLKETITPLRASPYLPGRADTSLQASPPTNTQLQTPTHHVHTHTHRPRPSRCSAPTAAPLSFSSSTRTGTSASAPTPSSPPTSPQTPPCPSCACCCYTSPGSGCSGRAGRCTPSPSSTRSSGGRRSRMWTRRRLLGRMRSRCLAGLGEGWWREVGGARGGRGIEGKFPGRAARAITMNGAKQLSARRPRPWPAGPHTHTHIAHSDADGGAHFET